MIEDFWNELNQGEIHARDNLQFELKSEFFINFQLKKNVYKQEVFIFIPHSLQINSETYSKQQFYLDQTNLIRYKTPFIPLSKLIDPQYPFSPLNRLKKFIEDCNPNFSFEATSDEVKLFAAIFRASVRKYVYKLIKKLRNFNPAEQEKISSSIKLLCIQIGQVCDLFRQLQKNIQMHSGQPQLIRHFRYVDEFISTMIEEFLVILLEQVRSLKEHFFSEQNQICQMIIKENLYREKKNIGPKTNKGSLYANESLLHRQGLLNRFILEALMLNYFRFSLEEKHLHILGATTAGLAMFVYMTLFVWKISVFVINSFPFVALAVLFYILKDRIKEGLKILYYKQAHRWFPDYSTEIKSPKGIKIGKLTENFTFIDYSQLPPYYLKIRNRYFHEELQALQRHETIIHYKREVTLHFPPSTEMRRRELTAIFRFNIHRFLQKASNVFQSTLILDPHTQEISQKILPKVYHLNLIICNTYPQIDRGPKIEIKTFRVVIDKEGIKRVEHITQQDK